MINVYIVSGFLGAGKTSFIQRLLKDKKFEKVMLIENEFGEVGVDGAFFDESLKVKEINNGCICCSLQGDFESALEEIESYGITDLIVEPSGVGKLSEIISVIGKDKDYRIVSHICVVDVKTCKKYHHNFKEYFDDQVVSANALILSHLDVADEKTKEDAIAMLKEINNEASISDKPLDEYSIDELLDMIVKGGEICPECLEHHHHHHDHHHHEHHHDHDHDHHHHHHHDDEDFESLMFRPTYHFTKEELEDILKNLDEDIIRCKGYVLSDEGTLYFNYVLNEYEIFIGKEKEEALVLLIASKLDEEKYKEVFHG